MRQEQPKLSVTQLNEYIKRKLDGDDLLQNVCVQGELSNYKIYNSGHHYFTLKDAGASLRCVMFRSAAARLRFRPDNGMAVFAYGHVSVFPRDGAYQLYVEALQVQGVGDLQMAYEQLKAKLQSEGLFAPQHKKPLPPFPRRIAVVTSSDGAAVRDIIRVAGKRYPLAQILVLPVRVQGVEAPPEIVAAIEYANAFRVADLLITGRGGGSLEDLWAFNDERVARAIYRSVIPVISAVGHEPDVTISDYVADRRAATPSNAAEIAVPDQMDLYGTLHTMQSHMDQLLNQRLTRARQILNDFGSRRVLQSPTAYIEQKRMELDLYASRLSAAAERYMQQRRHRYATMAAQIDALSPLKVLARGYSVATVGEKFVKQIADVDTGAHMTVHVSDGQLQCVVEGKTPQSHA